MDPVSNEDLARLIEEEMRSGVSFENDDEKDSRERALRYYDGVMKDLPHEEGRSGVVARITAEQIDRMLPGLLRLFGGTDRVAIFAPARPNDEEMAAQATDYVNYVFLNECDGSLVLATLIMDALQVRNGIGKVYWDTERDSVFERMTGLSGDQLTLLVGAPEFGIQGDPDFEMTASREYQRMIEVPGQGVVPVTLYDVEGRRYTSDGRLRIECVPGERFGISKRATGIDTAPWVWEWTYPTRSDLIKRGVERSIVEDLPAYSRRIEDDVRRGPGDRSRERDAGTDPIGATAIVEVIEAYGFVDCDGDGVAEGRKVVFAGAVGSRRILLNEPWDNERPYFDLKPHVVPHRWEGRSVADQTMDLQRVQTALWRGALDNLYAQNYPMWEVMESSIINPDEVRERRFNGLVRVKSLGSVSPLTVPNVAGVALEGIAAVDAIVERRTGVSQATPSLDETALNPQTATAAQLEHDAGYARTELVARNFAHLGLRPMFRKALKLIVANQDRPRTLRLRDKWVEFDPRAWNAGMDVSINLGLGTGSRERDMAMLNAVISRMEIVFQKYGPNNPVVSLEQIVGAYHKLVEASGLRNPEQFFKMPTPEQIKAYMATKPPPMDPKIAAIQARAQAEAARLQQSGQLAVQKLAADAQARREKAAIDAEADRDEAAADLQQQRERMEAETAMQMERLRQEFDLRVQELHLEADLKREALHAGLHVAGGTNLARVN